MRQLKITQQITKRDTQSLTKYLNEISSIPMISADEEANLAKLAKQGDKRATDKLVTANLRFVISVAKQYQTTGDLLDDLISAGNLGLIEAAKRFDETKGFKFISYAVWWIRQSIVQYISENNKTIRIPSNKINASNKLKNVSSDLEQILERKPTLSEIADAYEDRFEDSITEDTVYEVLYCNVSSTSLDAKVTSDEDAGTLLDFIQGDGFTDVTSSLTKNDLKITILQVVEKLSKIERYVLLSYYGINCREKSLNELGEELDLTRERVRQIKEKCLRKLKLHSFKKLLKEYN
jgi:RNA polymerase primary sigma factor